jgi:protein-tyrosine phosphatase
MAEIENILRKYRSTSRGFIDDPPAVPFRRLMVGAGFYLNPIFTAVKEITHVINCADENACPLWARSYLGKNYAHVPTPDMEGYPILANDYSKFEAIMDNFLSDPGCRNVFIHCQAGMNRSATLAAAYTVRRFRIPLEKVVDGMGRQRPCIMTNTSYKEQLSEFASNTK